MHSPLLFEMNSMPDWFFSHPHVELGGLERRILSPPSSTTTWTAECLVCANRVHGWSSCVGLDPGKIVGMATAVEMRHMVKFDDERQRRVTCFTTVGCGNALVGDRPVTLEQPSRRFTPSI
jgi:hypothetical protein